MLHNLEATVAVGSEKPDKILSGQPVINILRLTGSVVGFGVPSGISAQPRTRPETAAGALNRAVNVLDYFTGGSFSSNIRLGVGIESGVYEVDDIGRMVTFAAVRIVDCNGVVGVGETEGIALPDDIANLVYGGHEVRSALQVVKGVVVSDCIYALTDGMTTARASFEIGVRNAAIDYRRQTS